MKGLISEKLRKRLWEITKKEMGDFYNDKAHGREHLKAVYKNFIILLKEKPKISKDILESLECAVIIHDIGRVVKNNEKHGAESVKILKEEKNLILPNKEWVFYAVKWHSECGKIFKKQKTEPKKNKERWLCLAFLALLDHMDAVGKRVIKRAKEYLPQQNFGKKVPLIPEESPHLKLKNIDNLKEWFLNPQRENISPERKNKSLLEHLCANYFWTDKNIFLVKKRISKKFEQNYRKRAKELEKYILNLATRE